MNKKEPAVLIDYIVLDAVLSAFGYAFQQVVKGDENEMHEQLLDQSLGLLQVMVEELEIDETKINPTNKIYFDNFKKIDLSFETGEAVQLEITSSEIH